MLGIFGREDRYIALSDVEAFEDAMKTAHKSIDIEIYPHVGHAFENSDYKLGYHEAAAEDAWQRTVAFLDHNLK